MLRLLRRKKTMKRLLWGLALIIIPAFVFWGAGGAIRSKRESTYAGKIFGRKVSFDQYAKSWHAVKNQAIMMYGSRLEEVIEKLNLGQQAWERLILLKE